MIKHWQWISIDVMIIGVLGMGAHLFLFDGIKNPTPVLTVFACLYGFGLIGLMTTSFLLLRQEMKRRKEARETIILFTRRYRKMVATAMLIGAIAFVAYAFMHPEMSFPWHNAVTWLLYAVYGTVMMGLFIF